MCIKERVIEHVCMSLHIICACERVCKCVSICMCMCQGVRVRVGVLDHVFEFAKSKG